MALNWIVAFLSCALVAGAINRSLPLPKVRGVSDKYQYLAAHRDRYDLLFVGSSRFFHQIDPRQFDARLAELGHPSVRSFNFGVDAMWPPESLYVLRQILALRPPKLRWVIIEMMEIKAVDDGGNTTTLRRAYWHDWRHTRLAFEDIFRSKFSLGKKCDLVVEHAVHCAKKSLNFGRGADWLATRLTRTKQSLAPKPWSKTNGFEPLPSTAMSAAELTNFEQAISRRRQKMEPQPLHPLFRRALSELVREIRAFGAEPIFVITPTIRNYENYAEAPDGAALFAFNDPTVYGELFDARDRFDSGHLDGSGASKFTAVLAGRIAERIGPRP